MWFTLLVVVACIIGIPLLLLSGIVALLILLPIHFGATGYYREDSHAFSGWAKAFAGLCGVVFEYTEEESKVQVVFWKWTIWRPNNLAEEDSSETESVVTPQPSVSPRPHPVATRPKESAPQVEPTDDGVSSPSRSANLPDSPEPVVQRLESERVNERSAQQQLTQVKSGDGEGSDSEIEEEGFWTRFKRLREQVSRYLDYWREAQPILIRFLKRLLRLIWFRQVDVEVDFGAEDPATTGKCFGYVEAIRPMLGKRVSFVLNPVFTQSTLSGAGVVELSFSLRRLLWALLALGVRGGLLAFKIWRREKKLKRDVVLKEA